MKIAIDGYVEPLRDEPGSATLTIDFKNDCNVQIEIQNYDRKMEIIVDLDELQRAINPFKLGEKNEQS